MGHDELVCAVTPIEVKVVVASSETGESKARLYRVEREIQMSTQSHVHELIDTNIR